MEVLLPLDYYCELIGVRTDMKVFTHLCQKKFPKLSSHLTKIDFNLEMILTKWFVCLFINALPIELEMFVLDMFFTRGTSFIIKIALSLF
jgi:hypothetical protein